MGTLSVYDKTVKTWRDTGMHPAFIFVEGGLSLRLYIICLIFKITLLKPSCKYNITLQWPLYAYAYNYMFHDPTTVSFSSPSFLNFINLFFKILYVLVVSRFQWMISADR
jgi:hypothetical protein